MGRRPRASSARTRKNMDMDAEKLAKAQELLGTKSETETVDKALDYVVFQGEVFGALDRLAAAGGLEDVFTASRARPVRRVAEP